MKKYFQEWNKKKFPVRIVQLPSCLGGFEAKVADVELYYEYKSEYEGNNPTAIALDCSIYYFCDSGFIASDPSDEEIIDYLIKEVM